jgi:hypothetical protein
MAEDRVVDAKPTWRQLMPWTQLFRGFEIALDINKLLLAAAGIVVMAAGWWLLSLLFTANEQKTPPAWPERWKSHKEAEDTDPRANSLKAWALFRQARLHWNLMHEAAGLGAPDAAPPAFEVEDLAETLDEYTLMTQDGKVIPPTAQACEDRITALENQKDLAPEVRDKLPLWRTKYLIVGQIKPAGRLSTWPWWEDRGPNPYLLVTGQTGIPWQAGSFWDWFLRDQAPVMIEPLVKFVRPIIYFLSPRNTFSSRLYFLLVTLWTLLTWSVFGGAITRIAAVQIARNDSVGLFEALRFTLKRYLAYLTAPLFPLIFVFVMLILLGIYGLAGMIPVVGDILIWGLFWPLALLAGIGMAVALVGLVSWPLMAATVSTEGSDSWEAVSRAYSYLINRPWQCAWYALVAIAYGGVVVFFVGFMSSLAVYLAKWGVTQTPAALAPSREPDFLFVYAPTSFGWRELLLEGARVQVDAERDKDLTAFNGAEVVPTRAARPAGAVAVGGVSRYNRINPEAYNAYYRTLSWYHKFGAFLVGIWLGAAFLAMLGFGYAYFWSASTIIYMLLRRTMDAAEMDEVYFEEDEYEGFRAPPSAPIAPAPPVRPTSSLPVVEAPRPTPVAVGAPSPPVAAVAPTPAVSSTSPPVSPVVSAAEPKPAPIVTPPPMTGGNLSEAPAAPPEPAEKPDKQDGGIPPI